MRAELARSNKEASDLREQFVNFKMNHARHFESSSINGLIAEGGSSSLGATSVSLSLKEIMAEKDELLKESELEFFALKNL